jgi:tetratricopeptide (TPR) repeat protein
MEDMRSAVALPADNRFSRFNRGLAFVRLEDYENAVADFTFAIEEYRFDPDYFEQRGDAYWEMGEKAKAVADYQEYERLTGRLRGYMQGRVGETESDTNLSPLVIFMLIGGAIAIAYLRFGHMAKRFLRQ